MRPLLVTCLALGLLLAAPAAATAKDADAVAIRTVIEKQIAAFQKGDLVAAFAFASPGIQGKFGDATNFGLMVKRGYPMIWRPKAYKIGVLEDGPRGPTQTVVFVDQDGLAWEADYLMRDIDGHWRIGGVVLRKLPGVVS